MKKRLIGLVFITLVLTLPLPRPAHAQLTWNFPGTNLTNDQNVDVMPAIVRTPNSTLITVYTSVRGGSVALYGQVYANTTNSWSPQYRLTNEDPNQDTAASLAVFSNGTAFIAWQTNRTGYNDIMVGRTDGTQIWGVQALVTNATNDGSPSVAISRYGTVWVFWVRYSSQLGPYSIYYKTYSGGVWSGETLYSTGASLNNFPSATATKDGRVWLVFAERNSVSIWQLWTAYNTNGTWSTTATNIVSSSNNDVAPSITQDRAGSIWIIWSREFISGLNSVYLMYSTFSSDNGATFPSTNQLQITFDSTLMRDDVHPAVAQGFDKSLWVEYASDPTSSSGMIFNIWIGNSSPITGIHDVAVSSIRANSARWLNGGIGIGANVTLSVGVTDYGDYSEMTTLTIYYVKSSTQTILGSQSVTLAPGTTISVTFLMYTGSTPVGNYTFKATVTAVPGESVVNQGDNQLFAGRMIVTIPQDLTRDFDVDIDDLSLMQAHLFTPNLAYDVNFDKKVDVADLISVWQHLYIPITATHDVGITSIKIPQYIYRGQTINVNVTVVNEGTVSENFNLMLFYNSTSKTIASVTVSSLAPSTMRTVSIPWNTTTTSGVSTPTGGCYVSAYIPPLASESHTLDNNFTAQYTLSNCIRKTGDVDATPDGAIDITDVLAVYQHEFTTLAQYDVNGDGKVDVSDLIATFLHEFT